MFWGFADRGCLFLIISEWHEASCSRFDTATSTNCQGDFWWFWGCCSNRCYKNTSLGWDCASAHKLCYQLCEIPIWVSSTSWFILLIVLCYVITLFLQTCVDIISFELMVRRSPWLVMMAAIKTHWIISLAVCKLNQMIPHLTWQQLLCASCLFFKQTWMESQNYIGIQLSLSSSSWTTFITWSDLSESKQI